MVLESWYLYTVSVRVFLIDTVHFSQINAEKRIQAPSPIMYMMAEKNSVEKGGMRLSHIRDSAAMCNILAKLNDQVITTKRVSSPIIVY